MTAVVAGAVLFSALLHAIWNAIAKAIPDRLVASALIGATNLVIGGLGCLLLPIPAPASWPALLGSALLQTAYLILLTAAYSRSEFGRAYPLVRGVAVVGVTAVSVALLGETLQLGQWIGVGLVAAALLGLAAPGRGSAPDLHALAMPAAVGLVVAAYSLVDGVGVRVAGHALGYAAWLFFLQGIAIPLACLVLSRDRAAFFSNARRSLGWGVLGGVLSLVAYGIVVWAQSLAPLALVSALRETSVLMAGLIGFLAFREKLTLARVTATVTAAVGIVVLRLGG